MSAADPRSTSRSITDRPRQRSDADALNQLFEDLYAELHALARARIHRNSPITMLDTTSLLHEFYLRSRTSERSLRQAARAS